MVDITLQTSRDEERRRSSSSTASTSRVRPQFAHAELKRAHYSQFADIDASALQLIHELVESYVSRSVLVSRPPLMCACHQLTPLLRRYTGRRSNRCRSLGYGRRACSKSREEVSRLTRRFGSRSNEADRLSLCRGARAAQRTNGSTGAAGQRDHGTGFGIECNLVLHWLLCEQPRRERPKFGQSPLCFAIQCAIHPALHATTMSIPLSFPKPSLRQAQ